MPTQRRCQPWLGTLVDIRAKFDHVCMANAAMGAAFDAIRRVHMLMSPREAGGDIARINRSSAGTPVCVHHWTAAVLGAAMAFERETEGALSVSIAAPTRKGEMLRRGEGGFRIDGNQVTLRGGAYLDLGGIAKGYAVDRAVDALVAGGAQSGCVNAGGDLRFFGDMFQSFCIRHPDAPERLVPVATLRNAAAATSYFGMRAEHLAPGGLVDGRSGQSELRGLVTVLAPDCMTADALTKVAGLLGSDSDDLLAAYGAEALWWPAPASADALEAAA